MKLLESRSVQVNDSIANYRKTRQTEICQFSSSLVQFSSAQLSSTHPHTELHTHQPHSLREKTACLISIYKWETGVPCSFSHSSTPLHSHQTTPPPAIWRKRSCIIWAEIITLYSSEFILLLLSAVTLSINQWLSSEI